MSADDINDLALIQGNEDAQASTVPDAAQHTGCNGTGVDSPGDANIAVGTSPAIDTSTDTNAPMLDIHGVPVTVDTPRDDFVSPAAYLAYCMQCSLSFASPTVRLRTGKATSYDLVNQVTIEVEGRTDCVDLEDFDVESVLCLVSTVQDGDSDASFRTLVGAFHMAEMHDFHDAMQSIADKIKQARDLLQLGWLADAREVAMNAERTGTLPSLAYNERQKRRIVDISEAWVRLSEMAYGTRPVTGDVFVQLVLDHCPRPVLRDAFPDLDGNFKDALCLAALHRLPQ